MKISKNGMLQVVRFGLVGCCNTLVDYGVFYLMITAVNLHKSISQVIATAVAMCVSFLLNRKWTFQKAGTGNLAEIGKFIAVNLVSMLVVIVFTHLFYDILHIENLANAMLSAFGVSFAFEGDNAVMIAKLFASVFSVIVNFIGNKFWVFRTKKEEKTV